MSSYFFGRLPEENKQSLKTLVRQEMDHLLLQNPDLKLVVSMDGEKDNWTFSKSLNPDVEVFDFWHAAECLKLAAGAAFGSDELAGTKWFEAKCHTLRHDPNGVVIVIDALRYVLRKGRGSAEIREKMGYFRNTSRRMNYYHVANNGYSIGSDQVEVANNVLVAERLKRFGQRWGRDDRRRVLAYRALLKSDHFDRAWRMVVSQKERSEKHWDPV